MSLNPKTITLHNPEGKQEIVLSEADIHTAIQILDTDDGSRDFLLTVKLQGKNASANIKGVAQSRNKDRKKWTVSVQLEGQDQNAVLEMRGVADDNGLLEFDGGGVLRSDSENGSVDIDEKIILFSPTAKARALPVLRVETEHVNSASHSASIAPFSNEIFFYLSSRGIHPEQGKILLKEGFLGKSGGEEE